MKCPQCGAENVGDALGCASCGRALIDFSPTIDRTAPRDATERHDSPVSPKSGVSIPHLNLGPRYRIIRPLGEGGMGEVLLVHDVELDRNVAVKLIRGQLSNDPLVLDRFKREIHLASQITHKNVLRVYDLSEANGLKFLTMQYVEGQDLAALLREGRLSVPKVVDILKQMCEGLGAAHDQGVVHRDLKPQNVLIDHQGHVAIADFGLAKSLEQASLTEAGKIIGTPHYMSPEQVKGVSLDRRSDIYSLGIILYEMLTGTIPFSGSSAYEVMIQRLHHSPRPASDHNARIPAYLQRVLQRCLEIDPNLRYHSTSEILKDIESETFHTTIGYRMRRNRRITIAAGLLLALVAIGGGVAAWRAISAARIEATEAAHKPVSVLIADIDNATGEGVFDGTLEPILTLALEGAPFINSYNRTQAQRVATQIQPNASRLDERLARLVAMREGVNVVVSGTVSRAGSYHLAIRALDGATGKQIGQSEVTAKNKEEVLSAVGRAAADLRKALGDRTPMSVQLAAAETFTAASLEAAHEYGIARDLFWRGKFEEAAHHYEKAIELDPNLGRAYASLATVYANLGRKDDAEREYKRAMAHSDRMTDREKYRTRVSYYLLTHDNARAIEEVTQLLKEYPVDMAGLNNLPLAYFYSRDMPRALDESRRAISLYPTNYVARNNAALYAMYAGDFPTAIKQAQTVMTMNPSYLKAYIAVALSQLAQNDIAAATDTYRQLAAQSASGQSMANLGMADIALCQGAVAEAIATLKEGVERDRADKRNDSANRKLATLAAVSRDASAAEQIIATDTHDQHMLYTAARALIESGKEHHALAVASRLEALLEPELQHYGKLIEGEVLLKRRNARAAVAKFDEAKRLADSWLVRFHRGRAYLELGAFTEAAADFEACAKRRGEATAVFLDDIPTFHYLPPVYYYLGRAQEGLGSKGAKDSYQAYVTIRTKATSDPLVADAQKRLASIR